MKKESNRKTIYILSILVVLILGGLILGYLNSDLYKAAIEGKEKKSGKNLTCSISIQPKGGKFDCEKTEYKLTTQNCSGNLMYYSRYANGSYVDTEALNNGSKLSQELNSTGNTFSCDDIICFYANSNNNVQLGLNICAMDGNRADQASIKECKENDPNLISKQNIGLTCEDQCSYSSTLDREAGFGNGVSNVIIKETYYPMTLCKDMQTWVSGGVGATAKAAKEEANLGKNNFYGETGGIEMFKIPSSSDAEGNQKELAVGKPHQNKELLEDSYTLAKINYDFTTDEVFKKLCEEQSSDRVPFHINKCAYKEKYNDMEIDSRYSNIRSPEEVMKKGEKCNDTHPEYIGEMKGYLDCKLINGITDSEDEGGEINAPNIPIIPPDSGVQNKFSYAFGAHPASQRNIPGDPSNFVYTKDLGVGMNREGLYFFWTWADNMKNGNFKFKNASAFKDTTGGIAINFDDYQKEASVITGLKTIRDICPFDRDQFKTVEEENIYKTFVEKTVERYDGDDDLGCVLPAPDCYKAGDGEYPTDEFISAMKLSPIKYWQVCNNLIGTCTDEDCIESGKYAQEYAKVQQYTYMGIKKVCPDCQVLIAGDSGMQLYPLVFKILNGQYIDIIDKHLFPGEKGYESIKMEMDYLKKALTVSGFDITKLKFWITEMGTYSGDPIPSLPTEPDTQSYQSEAAQARALVKFHAFAFGYGIEKFFWAWGMEEGFGCDCCLFDYTGLVYDGNREDQACDLKDTYDLGRGVKKLAYYSLKNMINKLGNFSKVDTIQNSENFIYRFTNNGKSVYVAWNEKGSTLTLTSSGTGSVKITESVPNFESGTKVTDYNTAFKTETKSFVNGSVQIPLSATPVFVEVFSESSTNADAPSTGDNFIPPIPIPPVTPAPNVPPVPPVVPIPGTPCGDGTCDQYEQANPNICPIDCN